MKTFRLIPALAVAAVLAVALGLSACGDDESTDTSGDATAPGIGAGTTGTTTDPTGATGKPEGEEGALGEEKAGERKIKGPSETIPEIGVIPKPTKKQRQQIAECVEKAQGDPQELAKCGQIAVN